MKYQLVVKSKGGTAHGVVVCDTLPAHMTYVSLGNATMEDGKACWTVGDLTGSLTLSLTAKVDADAPAGSLTNNATATSSNAGKAKAHATINVPAQARRQGQAQAHAPASPASTLHALSGERTGGALPARRPLYRPAAWPAEPTSR